MIPIGIYFYFFFKRSAAFFKLNTNLRSVRMILALASAVFVGFAVNIWGFWAVVVLYLFMFALIVEFVNFLLVHVLKLKKRKVWNKIYRCGGIPVIITALVLCYGYWNMGHVVEKDYTVYTSKQIRDEGYRIVLITDLHYGISMNGEQLEEKCREIQATRPDLVVLGGDIFDERTTLSQMQEAVRILGSIESEYGIVYIYGNHDRALYSEEPNYTVSQMNEAIQSANIRILSDEQWRVTDDLVVVGREDRSYQLEGERKSSRTLLDGADREDYLLLLDHQPSELIENSEAGYDLQLSGHTHGGQIWPMGFLNDFLGFGEMNYGQRTIGDFKVIVSSGIAGWGYPVRTGSHSEYVVVDIVKQ